MDILGIFGFVFAATATGVLVYEHHMDVLSGPYIEGREPARIIAAMLEAPDPYSRSIVMTLIIAVRPR